MQDTNYKYCWKDDHADGWCIQDSYYVPNNDNSTSAQCSCECTCNSCKQGQGSQDHLEESQYCDSVRPGEVDPITGEEIVCPPRYCEDDDYCDALHDAGECC